MTCRPPMRDARTRCELEAALKAAKAGVALARAEVARAEATVRFSSLELVRKKKLPQQHVVSKRALQRSELDLETEKAELHQAKANLDFRFRELELSEARIMDPNAVFAPDGQAVCCIELRSPTHCAVLKLFAESEQVVHAGKKLLEIGDRTKVEIVAGLLSTDAVKVKAGNLVWIENWGGSHRLRGKVRRIDPAGFMKVSALGIEEQRVNAIIEITEPRKNWLRLGHDYRVYVRIVTWRGDNILRVPLSALFRRGPRWAVFVVKDEKAIETPIAIGARSKTYSEVVSGLEQGSMVVLHPSDRIAHLTAVTPRQAVH